MTAPNPMGCHWCGIDQRPHARQWTVDAGWHTWAPPTQEQTKDRMRARRSARTERIDNDNEE